MKFKNSSVLEAWGSSHFWRALMESSQVVTILWLCEGNKAVALLL